MRDCVFTHLAMHPTKPPLRFENLDLFAAPSNPSAWSLPAVVAADVPAESGFRSFFKPEDQLDIFRHSPIEIAATATRRALKKLDIGQARSQLTLLRQTPGQAGFIADADQCIELIEQQDGRWADTAIAVAWIETELWPAATRCLQRDALLLVHPALMALLERNTPSAFDVGCRHAHPSYLWQLLDEPTSAVAALELDPHWREQAPTLLWHAQLSEQAKLQERVSADVLELCVAHPEAAESWLSSSDTWELQWSAWSDLDELLPIHAFPAWCRLTYATEFAPQAATDQRPGAQLLRIAEQLASHPADLALRKALNALCPALLAVFLANRTARAN